MATRLDQIVDATRRHVVTTKSAADVRDLERRARDHEPRGFRRQLVERSKIGPAVIAELKKASPSKGLIREDFDPQALAMELEAAGAAALSVLTDEEFFQGSLENLRLASTSTHLPCLRKDFIVDDFQLLEARANCADAVLLIVAALQAQQLASLHETAGALGLDVLMEVHDEAELALALALGADLIGINNRDLRDFSVDLQRTSRLLRELPAGITVVSESGISSAEQLHGLEQQGVHAVLVGESLMRAVDPEAALLALRAAPATTRAGDAAGPE